VSSQHLHISIEVDFDLVIRVEWCKCHARAKRWSEEVILLKEEMRRTLVSLEYVAAQWDRRMDYKGSLQKGKSAWPDDWEFAWRYSGPLIDGTDKYHQEGVTAYAKSQAAVYRNLAAKFRKMWAVVGAKEKAIEEGEDLSQVLRAKVVDSDSEDSGAEDYEDELFFVVPQDESDGE
jgi:hypothetical protein